MKKYNYEKISKAERNSFEYMVFIDHKANWNTDDKCVLFKDVESALQFMMCEDCRNETVYNTKLYKLAEKANSENADTKYTLIYSKNSNISYSLSEDEIKNTMNKDCMIFSEYLYTPHFDTYLTE